MSRADLEDLEIFARAVAALHDAEVELDVRAMAEAYGVDLGDDPDADDEEDDEDERTDEELAAAHRAREAAP